MSGDGVRHTPTAAQVTLNLGPTFRIDPSRQSTPRFIWPVSGPVSNYFTPKHPLGIDIGLAIFPASRVVASAGGQVVFAGGEPCCSYGLHVIVDHGEGLSSVYSHLSSIEVAEGQYVTQGQLLGISGSTGRSTSEHLHFEIRRGEERLDPMHFLSNDKPLG